MSREQKRRLPQNREPGKCFSACGRTCSRYTGQRWDWLHGYPPESGPESSSLRQSNGKHTAGQCRQYTCWHDSSSFLPPFLWDTVSMPRKAEKMWHGSQTTNAEFRANQLTISRVTCIIYAENIGLSEP